MDQSKTLVRALLYGTVWVDEPSPFVVSEVANTYKSNTDNLTVQYPGDWNLLIVQAFPFFLSPPR